MGGGTGAGKSTIARQLSRLHSLRLYDSDRTISDHGRRSNPIEHPLVHAFRAMDMDERWVRRSPSVMLETFHGFQGEGFEFIVEDLLALPEDPPILVEGFRLLPRLVAPLLTRPHQAVWLLPTAEFRRAAFESRGFSRDIPTRTSEPERALANLLERDALFTSAVAKEAAALQLRVITVDIDRSLEEATALVAEALGLG
jgi:2-phosphoglycerate kinase